MRIENIADVFDSDGKVIYQTVDVRRIAQELYAAANGVDAYSVRVQLIETSLTANQTYKQMQQNRLRWRTVDDALDVDDSIEDDEELSALKFQQQRIRTFKVIYPMERGFLQ